MSGKFDCGRIGEPFADGLRARAKATLMAEFGREDSGDQRSAAAAQNNIEYSIFLERNISNVISNKLDVAQLICILYKYGFLHITISDFNSSHISTVESELNGIDAL